jgi:hypothetical protein
VANAIDRALCSGLSARFTVVAPGEPADLTVQAVLSRVGVTDVTAAAASKAVTIGGAVAGAAMGVPVPLPRLPLGLGGLAVEAQARNATRGQVAAMTWARGADILTTRARLSTEGDAYALAKEFAADFARLLVTGADPIKDPPVLSSMYAVSEFFGGKPKHAACDRFGLNPGLIDTLGGAVGLPPAWTDAGPSPRKTP